jgi:hypothetical protein
MLETEVMGQPRAGRRSGQRLGQGIAVAVTATAALIGASAPAQGNCVAPVDKIIWSYPADGATGVPTNARLFVLRPSGLSTGSVRVNGQLVESDPTDRRLGFRVQLEPSTTYLVEVPSSPAPLSFRFTTGTAASLAPAPSAPIVERTTTETARSLPSFCRSALSIGECFDTPPYVDRVFETGSRPVFFVVRWLPPAVYPATVPQPSEPVIVPPVYWPAECGHPELFEKPSICFGTYRLSAVGITGEEVTADYACNRPADATTGESTAGGCTTGRGAPSAPVLLTILIGLALVRARRA